MSKEENKVKEFPTSENLPENNVRKMQLPEDRFPISAAYLKMLNRRVPGDPQRRTYVELIAEVMVYRALKGDVRAARELREATGGCLEEFYNSVASRLTPLHQSGKGGDVVSMRDGSRA